MDDLVEQLSALRGERPAQLDDAQYADMQAAEASLHEFTKQAWEVVEPDHEFRDGWHIEGIALHLEAVLAGVISKLLINVPPGTSKSLLTGVFWPAWGWIHNPSLRWLYASYGQELSSRDSRKCRLIIESDWYQTRWGSIVSLAGDQNQVTKFENTARGWRIATSVGGRGLGEHPDVIVADDANKVKEGANDTERTSVKNWWDGTISSRGKLRDVRKVTIAQRLHQDDLSGHQLSKNDPDLVHICLPMRFEPERMPDTPLHWNDPRTEPGQLLWEAGYPLSKVEETEREMGSLRAAGQLQQRPVSLGGSLFHRNWFEIVDVAPRVAKRLRYWDKASKMNAGCYTVGARMALGEDGVVYIENIQRKQLSPNERNKLMLQTAQLDASETNNTLVTFTEREGGSGGTESAEATVVLLGGFPVYWDFPKGDKLTRALPFAAQAEAGNVRLVRGPWNAAFLDEAEYFPNSTFKDQIDAVSAGYAKLAKVMLSIIAAPLVTSAPEGEDDNRMEPIRPEEYGTLDGGLRSLLEGLEDLGPRQ